MCLVLFPAVYLAAILWSISTRTHFHWTHHNISIHCLCLFYLDNTNANQETREHYTTLAKELSIPVRVIHFLSPPELCKHNATVRAANKNLVRSLKFHQKAHSNPWEKEHHSRQILSILPSYGTFPWLALNLTQAKFLLTSSQNPESRISLPGIAFADYKRRYQEPTLDEGFEDIHPVPFRFVGDEEAKRIWGQYWI
jgi:bifunctional polynucleotide phosphatase/kinase